MNFQALRTPLSLMIETDQLLVIRTIRADRLITKLKKTSRRALARKILEKMRKLQPAARKELLAELEQWYENR